MIELAERDNCWLNKLNQFGGHYLDEMVRALIISSE